MLYIIRHGRTEWNEMHKLQGKTDIPLSRVGVLMAELEARRCSSLKFDICFTSPLKRAEETARILLKGKDVPIFTDDRLIELGFGKYEGLTESDNIPEPLNMLFTAPELYQPDGGAESLQSLYERTGSFLEEKVFPLLRQNKNVLIVGHGAMNCSIICRIKEIPLGDFWSVLSDNCKMIKLC